MRIRLFDWEPGSEKAAEDEIAKRSLDYVGRRTNMNGAVVRFSWFNNAPFVWYVFSARSQFDSQMESIQMRLS